MIADNHFLESPSAAGRGAAHAASTARRAAETAWPVVAQFGLVALSERVETIGNGQHKVAGEGIVLSVVDVVGGHGALYILVLLEQVKLIQGYLTSFCREVNYLTAYHAVYAYRL